MVKQVQMTFRVESELRTRFAEAAGLEDRAAAQILREFMQTYVSSAKEKALAKSNISPDEQRKRQAAVNAARASVGLEGFKLAPDTERIAQRFINGEIDFNEFMRMPPMQSQKS